MDGNHPKRKKDKFNPYSITAKDGRYTLSFTDSEGTPHEIEIEKELFDLFDCFELEDISYLNRVSRHYEHSEMTDETLNSRAFAKGESVEETVLRNIVNEQLHTAISKLPETQCRRLKLHYLEGLTYKQIAELERCTHPAVIKSVSQALEKLKKFFQE